MRGSKWRNLCLTAQLWAASLQVNALLRPSLDYVIVLSELLRFCFLHLHTTSNPKYYKWTKRINLITSPSIISIRIVVSSQYFTSNSLHHLFILSYTSLHIELFLWKVINIYRCLRWKKCLSQDVIVVGQFLE